MQLLWWIVRYNLSIVVACHASQIPIRNIVVMINDKPKEAFKHVKVLSLNELNGYLSYFDPIFNSTEVEGIHSYLNMKMH